MMKIGEHLKTIRLSRGLSLLNVSESIRISVKNLEDIEKDSDQNLPAAYAQAFIKEYANFLGINLSDLSAVISPQNSQTDQAVLQDKKKIVSESSDRPKYEKKKYPMILLFIILLSVLGLVFSIVLSSESRRRGTVREIDFKDVIKEWENRYSDGKLFTSPFADSLLVKFSSDTASHRRTAPSRY